MTALYPKDAAALTSAMSHQSKLNLSAVLHNNKNVLIVFLKNIAFLRQYFTIECSLLLKIAIESHLNAPDFIQNSYGQHQNTTLLAQRS